MKIQTIITSIVLLLSSNVFAQTAFTYALDQGRDPMKGPRETLHRWLTSEDEKYSINIISKTKLSQSEYAISATLNLNGEEVCYYKDQKVNLNGQYTKLSSDCDHQFITKAHAEMYAGVRNSGFEVVVESFVDNKIIAKGTGILVMYNNGAKN